MTPIAEEVVPTIGQALSLTVTLIVLKGFAPGKTGLIVNLYIKETQDEKWLRNRQKKTINATHVESIKQIKEALSQASLNYLNVEQ